MNERFFKVRKDDHWFAGRGTGWSKKGNYFHSKEQLIEELRAYYSEPYRDPTGKMRVFYGHPEVEIVEFRLEPFSSEKVVL